MSKYKVGDVVRTTKQFDREIELFPIGTIGTIQKIEEASSLPYKVVANDDYWWYSEDMIETFAAYEERTYEQGLNDAWELAHKINNMTLEEVHRVYGFSIHREELFSAVDAQEALDKLEAYEKAQEEIKVGDVVYADDEPDAHGIVTWIGEGLVYIMWDDGSCGSDTALSEIHKTGKHIDISAILAEVKGGAIDV